MSTIILETTDSNGVTVSHASGLFQPGGCWNIDIILEYSATLETVLGSCSIFLVRFWDATAGGLFAYLSLSV